MAIEVYGAGGANKEAEQKTVTPTTSQQTVTPTDEDHELTQVTVNAMPSGALAAISVSASGLITGKVSTSGYLAANTSKTKQLTTKAGQSYTPGTEDKTIINSGVYTTGAQVVKGDANLVPENIRKGLSLFGINGDYSGKGMYAWSEYSVADVLKFEPDEIKTSPAGGTSSTTNTIGLISYKGTMYYFLTNAYFTYENGSFSAAKNYGTNCTPANTGRYSVIEHNGELYFVGGQGKTFKFDGTNWTLLSSASGMPNGAGGALVSYKGELHYMCFGNNASNYHYKSSDGITWTSVGAAPITTYSPWAVVYNNKIYLMGSTSSTSTAVSSATYDGSSWSGVTATPFKNSYYQLNHFGIIDGELYVVYAPANANPIQLYKLNGSTWEFLYTAQVTHSASPDLYSACVHNDTFYVCLIGNNGGTVISMDNGFFSVVHKEKEKQEFYGIVVDDDENAYPTSGIKGELYYEKVGVGGGYAFGSFTGSSNNYYITIPHNLGFTPSWFFAFARNVSSTNLTHACAYNVKVNQFVSLNYYRGNTTTQAVYFTDNYKNSTSYTYIGTDVITVARATSNYNWEYSGDIYWACGE